MDAKQQYKAAYSAYRLYLTAVTDGIIGNYRRPRANVALAMILKSLSEEKWLNAAIKTHEQCHASDPYTWGVKVYRTHEGKLAQWGGMRKNRPQQHDEIPL